MMMNRVTMTMTRKVMMVMLVAIVMLLAVTMLHQSIYLLQVPDKEASTHSPKWLGTNVGHVLVQLLSKHPNRISSSHL